MTAKELNLMSSLALLLIECQQPQKAILFLRALIVLVEGDKRYIHALAWAYLRADQPENALRTLKLAFPNEGQALPHLLLAQTLAKLKNFEEASQELALFLKQKQLDLEIE